MSLEASAMLGKPVWEAEYPVLNNISFAVP